MFFFGEVLRQQTFENLLLSRLHTQLCHADDSYDRFPTSKNVTLFS